MAAEPAVGACFSEALPTQGAGLGDGLGDVWGDGTGPGALESWRSTVRCSSGPLPPAIGADTCRLSLPGLESASAPRFGRRRLPDVRDTQLLGDENDMESDRLACLEGVVGSAAGLDFSDMPIFPATNWRGVSCRSGRLDSVAGAEDVETILALTRCTFCCSSLSRQMRLVEELGAWGPTSTRRLCPLRPPMLAVFEWKNDIHPNFFLEPRACSIDAGPAEVSGLICCSNEYLGGVGGLFMSTLVLI